MFSKLKQIKDLRDQAKEMKKMLDSVVVVGASRSNKVMVTLNGSHEVLGVQIEDGTEKSAIEQGVKEAFVDANSKLQKELMTKMQADGGMGGLGDLMKNLG